MGGFRQDMARKTPENRRFLPLLYTELILPYHLSTAATGRMAGIAAIMVKSAIAYHALFGQIVGKTQSLKYALGHAYMAQKMAQNNSHKASYDVVIMGGGMSGLVLALALARYDIDSAVVDIKTMADLHATDDVRVSAFSASSWEFLDTIGIAEDVTEKNCPINAMSVCEALKGGAIDFDPRKMAMMTMGQTGHWGGCWPIKICTIAYW